jgi:UDPglucose--hexose-1-phosphate uridylyltransferase
VLRLDGFGGLVPVETLPPIQEILDGLCQDAYERGVIGGNSAAYFDLFDTALIGAFLPRPAEIIRKFGQEYRKSPEAATSGDFFAWYQCHYIFALQYDYTISAPYCQDFLENFLYSNLTTLYIYVIIKNRRINPPVTVNI